MPDRAAAVAPADHSRQTTYVLEAAVKELRPALEPLDLSAGGARNAAGLDQNHGMCLQPMAIGDGLHDVARHGFRVEIAVLAQYLLHHHQPLLTFDVDRERRVGARAQRGVTLLDRFFDVLRIMITAADDDRVLDPALDAKLSVVEEGEVAGTEEGTLAGIGEIRLERLGRLFRPLPVAPGHVRAADPDLAEDAVRARQAGLGIDDEYSLIEFLLAAADDLADRAVLDFPHAPAASSSGRR